MKMMIPAIITTLLFSFAVNAEMGNATFEPPTHREGADGEIGEPLELSEIDHFKVFVNGSPTMVIYKGDVVDKLPNDATGFSVDLPLGESCITMTTVDTDGRESLYSNEVCDTAKGDPYAPRIKSFLFILR